LEDKNKPQAVCCVGLTTWKKDKNKPQVVRCVGLTTEVAIIVARKGGFEL